MIDTIVRVEKIELNNFKNVQHGIIDLKNDMERFHEYELHSDLIGIYGQNGSGKTAVVNAFEFLKLIMSGKSLPTDSYNYIYMFNDTAMLSFDFFIKHKEEEYIVTYEFELKKENHEAIINREKLSYVEKNVVRRVRKTLVEYDTQFESIIKPITNFSTIINKTENVVNLKVAQKLAQEKKSSLIFNNEFASIWDDMKEYILLKNIRGALIDFARFNLCIINTQYSGAISSNLIIPLSFRIEEDKRISIGNIGVALNHPRIIDKDYFILLDKIVRQMNIVLGKIVPGLQLELHNYGEEYDDKGNIGVKTEILSLKGKDQLPVKYESEGIKKIISIMSTLIAMYNNPAICMIVDELDSGIYEFLLGEILSVIESGGKGQIIFTSHNLRPLEVLDKDSIYFTTTNPMNRFIRLKNVKPNNNLRSYYIRSINLGGQQEEVYNETNEFEIQRAFRLAGEKYSVEG